MREAYRVEFERNARRAALRLPDRISGTIERVIDRLAQEPRPRGVLKLGGSADTYRLRVGEYRVLYSVFDRERLVKVVDILRRDTQAYRRLQR